MEPIRVLLVDPSAKVRNQVKRLLSTSDPIELVGETGDAAKAREMAADGLLDVLVIALGLEGADAVALAREIASRQATEPVVVALAGKKDTELLTRAMREGIKHFLTKPFAPNDLVEMVVSAHRAQVRRLVLRGPVRPARRVLGKVVSFFSAKGGVGKTSLLTNLLCELERRRVRDLAAADLDVQFGDVGAMLGLAPERTLTGLLRELPPWTPDLVQEFTVTTAAGTHVLLAASSPEYAEALTPELVEDVLSQLRRLYSLVLVDTSARFGPIEKAILGYSDDIVLLVSPEATTVKNVSFCLEYLDGLGVLADRLHLVINRGHPPTGGLEPDVIAQRLGRPVRIVVPSGGRHIVESVNAGVPYLAKPRKGGYAEAIASLARLVMPEAA